MASDNFNRTDSGANAGWGTASGGGTWSHTAEGSPSNTGFQILSNQAVLTAGFTLRAAIHSATLAADHFSQIRMVAGTGDSGEGVICRATDGNNFYRFFRLNGTTVRLSVYLAGVQTPLDTQTFSVVDTDVLMIQAVGSAITGWVNGVQRASATDATHAAGGAGAASTNTVTFDDFSSGDIGGGAAARRNMMTLLGAGN